MTLGGGSVASSEGIHPAGLTPLYRAISLEDFITQPYIGIAGPITLSSMQEQTTSNLTIGGMDA
jgi:hypothetical protein